jgi:hypothetical protein
MKINHLRKAFAWIIVLSSAFLVYSVFYAPSEVYAPNPEGSVCWDGGSGTYIAYGTVHDGAYGYWHFRKFCKCASLAHE